MLACAILVIAVTGRLSRLQYQYQHSIDGKRLLRSTLYNARGVRLSKVFPSSCSPPSVPFYLLSFAPRAPDFATHALSCLASI